MRDEVYVESIALTWSCRQAYRHTRLFNDARHKFTSVITLVWPVRGSGYAPQTNERMQDQVLDGRVDVE